MDLVLQIHPTSLKVGRPWLQTRIFNIFLVVGPLDNGKGCQYKRGIMVGSRVNFACIQGMLGRQLAEPTVPQRRVCFRLTGTFRKLHHSQEKNVKLLYQIFPEIK